MSGGMSGEVIVVGGGVIGLTTAVVLAERGARVRVWTREPVELTTSAVAGALWWPYRIEPEPLVGEWALQSLVVYEELAARPEETGVRMVEGVQGETRLDELGAWAARVPGLREARAEEFAGGGLWARLPLIDMSVHLPGCGTGSWNWAALSRRRRWSISRRYRRPSSSTAPGWAP